MTSQPFGKTPDGQEITKYTLTGAGALEVAVINYGAIVTSILTPDAKGTLGDVVHGFDNLDGYLKGHPYFGAIVGRYGNRIAKGRFTLNGKTYKLATNNGANSLHGGLKGFDKALWSARDASSKDAPALELMYTSKDGEEGYPGNLTVTVRYTVTPQNELQIDYTLTTDQDTVANVTNHSYFNLAGSGDVLGHVVQLDADRMTPVDGGLIPTGVLKPVAGTPFDFTTPTAIGARINQDEEQLKLGKGYDHNFVLRDAAPGTLKRAARVSEPTTKRTLEVWTTEPGVQFYTGNFLDGTLTGKGGRVYAHRSGFCLETQHFPDSPNQPSFPTTVIKPGTPYTSRTVYRFGVE
jgi:aldose 1-epimerase